MTLRASLLIFAVTVTPALAATSAQSPYVGQEQRAIKTLSSEEVRGYLAGDGLGYARAGELNHYPGPKHVLSMAEHLGLRLEQRTRIEAIAKAMTAEAIPLGKQIVGAEGALDRAFATGSIDEATLTSETRTIAELQGRLRATHLRAHLVLTPSQIAAYDALRGYGQSGAGEHHHM